MRESQPLSVDETTAGASPTEGEESFFAKAFDLPYFATPWHYHPEFELVLVVKSRGKRFIGNYVSDFRTAT
jgi:hypothetical protein